jgi:hypothetical protein
VHRFGLPLRSKYPPAILEVANEFLLLVSTEITGSPPARNACTSALMCSM